MTEDKPPVSQAGIIKLPANPMPSTALSEMMGPLMVDQTIRQAIQHCWMSLPDDERSPDHVEQEILRVVHRALQDLREDAGAFGYSKEDKSDWEERLARIRTQYPKAYERWTEEDDTLVSQRFGEGMRMTDLAKLFQRQPSAIRSRLAKLGLI